MISRLRGRLLARRPPHLLVEVGGVGIEVEAPMSTFYALPEDAAEVVLHTHLAVREDTLTVYGFHSEAERALFRTLIRVSGVGPRLALAILSGMSAEQFARCVEAGDAAALTRLPGVGRKTAERLLVEMRDRLPEAAGTGGAVTGGGSGDAAAEAVEALVALGYRTAEAERLVRAAAEPGLGAEALIRRALQRAVR
ncbi:Holliday junction branch migration protein RuvA [Inmirania thermothiophila]|uniref:Holliday junction branch migration complex subunit RuvA n=1 Tax=Inmirania thermothiophila TaxID=1750597 RepID=A0A3N1XUE2_9GAMM|nr:Holliday junction branch migration protein RuvA [Inmirania thermothiophila]ROR29801.1 Holliday junction DNA helicase subunit RuvA [Inmirania thermothiophila]